VFVRKRALDPIDFGGLRIFDYTAELGSGASLAGIEVPAGAAHALSWSTRSDKYYLVTAGSVRFTVDGETADLEAGDFCHVRCGQRFRYSNPSNAPAAIVLVHEPAFELAAERFEDE